MRYVLWTVLELPPTESFQSAEGVEELAKIWLILWLTLDPLKEARWCRYAPRGAARCMVSLADSLGCHYTNLSALCGSPYSNIVQRICRIASNIVIPFETRVSQLRLICSDIRHFGLTPELLDACQRFEFVPIAVKVARAKEEIKSSDFHGTPDSPFAEILGTVLTLILEHECLAGNVTYPKYLATTEALEVFATFSQTCHPVLFGKLSYSSESPTTDMWPPRREDNSVYNCVIRTTRKHSYYLCLRWTKTLRRCSSHYFNPYI